MDKIYLGNTTEYGRLYLSKHSWDCGWYWGFGDRFTVVKNEKTARAIAEKHRLGEQHEAVHARVTGNDLLRMLNLS